MDQRFDGAKNKKLPYPSEEAEDVPESIQSNRIHAPRPRRTLEFEVPAPEEPVEEKIEQRRTSGHYDPELRRSTVRESPYMQDPTGLSSAEGFEELFQPSRHWRRKTMFSIPETTESKSSGLTQITRPSRTIPYSNPAYGNDESSPAPSPTPPASKRPQGTRPPRDPEPPGDDSPDDGNEACGRFPHRRRRSSPERGDQRRRSPSAHKAGREAHFDKECTLRLFLSWMVILISWLSGS